MKLLTVTSGPTWPGHAPLPDVGTGVGTVIFRPVSRVASGTGTTIGESIARLVVTEDGTIELRGTDYVPFQLWGGVPADGSVEAPIYDVEEYLHLFVGTPQERAAVQQFRIQPYETVGDGIPEGTWDYRTVPENAVRYVAGPDILQAFEEIRGGRIILADAEAARLAMLDGAIGLAALTALVEPALEEVEQAAAEALAVLGVTPATTSQTTADPPAPPAGVTSGVKFDAYGNRVLLKWAGNVWIQTSRIIGADGLPYRDARYYGMAAGRNAAQNAQGLLDAQGDAVEIGGYHAVQLAPESLALDPDMLAAGLALTNLELRGVPELSRLQAALTTRASLLHAGDGLVLRDVILDGLGRVPNALTSPGRFRMYRGLVTGITGTTTDAGRALVQNPGSTEFYLEDVAFSAIGGYENSVVGDVIGAHRAVLMFGQNAKLLRPRVLTRIGGSEDGDCFQWQTSQVAGDLWTSAGDSWIMDLWVPDFWKRVVKVQASDVRVIRGYIGQSDVTAANCAHAAVDFLGSRNSLEGARINLARASQVVAMSGNDNRLLDSRLRNAYGASFTEGRTGSSLKGILDSGQNNIADNTSVETCLFSVYYTSTSKGGKFLRPPKLSGQYGVIAENGSTGGTVKLDAVSGDPAVPTFMQNAVQLSTGTSGWDVEIGSVEHMVYGASITGTATGNKIRIGRVGANVTQAINTFGLASNGQDVNRLTDATTYRSSPSASLATPDFELRPGADPTSHFIGTRGDVLANLPWRVPNTVVKFYNTAAGVSDFTAATLVGQNTPQSVVQADMAVYGYPYPVEVIWGSGSIFQNGSSAYYPALWFKLLPVGLNGLLIEADYGSGYVTVATYTNLTPALYWRATTPAAIGAAIKVRGTLLGVTPGSGTLSWRRFILFYSQLGDLETDTISWAIFRKAHNPDGTHPTVTATFDFASIAANGDSLPQTVFLSGATTTSSIIVTPPANFVAIHGLIYKPYVSGPSTVAVRAENLTGAAIDPPSGVWTFTLVK